MLICSALSFTQKYIQGFHSCDFTTSFFTLSLSMLSPNTLLQNRYLVVRLIGQGGMGAVYEARDQRLNHTVALKETFFDEDEGRRAFEREARLLARLKHPALPRVSDYFSDKQGQFLVMEFIPGTDLGDMLKRRGGAFSLEEVSRWADQLLDVIEYLHGQQPPIIHRDIKPQNLKLNQQGQLILLDFGLAKGPSSATIATGGDNRSVFGYTPNYAPPEQMQGTGTDERSDLYSVAATLYHLLTGRKPVDALNRAMQLISNSTDPLTPAHQVNPAVPLQIGQALQQTMALTREQRPASVGELRQSLRARRTTPLLNTSPTRKTASRQTVDSTEARSSGSEAATVIHPSQELPPLAQVIPPGKQSDTQVMAPVVPVGTNFHISPSKCTVKVLSGHTSGVSGVCFTPNGQFVISGSHDTSIKIWDVETNQQTGHLLPAVGPPSAIESLAVSPRGNLLLSGTRAGVLRLWDLETGRELASLKGHGSAVHSLQFLPNGRYAVSGSSDNTLGVWDVERGRELWRLRNPHGSILAVAVSPDGRWALSGGHDPHVYLWDIETGQLLKTLQQWDSVSSIAFSPDGAFAVVGSGGKAIHLLQLETSQWVARFDGHTEPVTSVAFSPDGMLMVSGGMDSTVRLWDVESGRELCCFEDHTLGVTSVAFSPNFTHLASGGWDKQVRVWQLPEAE